MDSRFLNLCKGEHQNISLHIRSGWIILNGNYGVIIVSRICSIYTWTCVLHVLQLFEQITVTGGLDHTNNIKLCVMHGICVFHRNVWFANCLYCIKRCVIGQYASG